MHYLDEAFDIQQTISHKSDKGMWPHLPSATFVLWLCVALSQSEGALEQPRETISKDLGMRGALACELLGNALTFMAGLTGLDRGACFYYCRNIERLQRRMPKKQNLEQTTRYADMFSAMGTESRLRIMQLLLSAHPDGLVVGEIGNELDIPSSTLSHHLEKLKNEDLAKVRREGTFLWYSANIEGLQELLGFLYAECCTRNKAIEPRSFVSACK
jgi:ArsR family transcriptional regulator, arsenate/arsenite/antimonite-responsive transcriptional repressor